MKTAVLGACVAITLVFGISAVAFAQTAPLRSMIPDPIVAGLFYSQAGKTDLDSGGKHARYDVLYHGEMPLIWDDPLRLALFGDLRWTRVSLDQTPVGDLDVYKAAGTLDIHHEGFYPILLHGQFSVGLLSDLKEIDGGDARYRGKAVAEYPLTEKLSLLLGGARDEVLGDDKWHLVGGVHWQPLPELLLELQYPQSRVTLAPSKGVAFTLGAGYAGDNWTIFYDDQEYNLRLKNFALQGGAEFGLTETMWLRLFGGWLTDRSVDVWKGDRHPVKGDADDGYFTGIALLWR